MKKNSPLYQLFPLSLLAGASFSQILKMRWSSPRHSLARIGIAIFSLGSCFSFVWSGESKEISQAIKKSIPLLEAAATGTMSHRKCFTCHGHAVPFFALKEASLKGFLVDESVLKNLLDHTHRDLERGYPVYSENRGQGGGFTRAGYALWTLSEGEVQGDQWTDAVIGYLLNAPTKNGEWRPNAERLPSEGSFFTTMYVVLRGLRAFVPESQSSRYRERKSSSENWLMNAPARTTEDRVFRLLALQEIGAEDSFLQEEVNHLEEAQHRDGGWSKDVGTSSDVYSTATVLYALRKATGYSVRSDGFQSGIEYLIKSQKPDGSWHVVTDTEPVQKYYESGYPHGEDQFISMAAAGWATLVLLDVVEE